MTTFITTQIQFAKFNIDDDAAITSQEQPNCTFAVFSSMTYVPKKLRISSSNKLHLPTYKKNSGSHRSRSSPLNQGSNNINILASPQKWSILPNYYPTLVRERKQKSTNCRETANSNLFFPSTEREIFEPFYGVALNHVDLRFLRAHNHLMISLAALKGRHRDELQTWVSKIVLEVKLLVYLWCW